MDKQLTTEEKRKWIHNEVHPKYFTNKQDWHPEINGSRGKFYKIENAFSGEELIDANFYDNNNLSQQFYVKPVNTNSKVGGILADVAAESEIQKRIEKAEKETFGRLVLYASDKLKDIWVLDFLFFNRSFAREMEDFVITASVETSPATTFYDYREIVSSTPLSGENNHFYNRVTVAVNRQDILEMAQKKAEFRVTFDDVTVKFKKEFKLIDVLAVDFLNDNDNWDDETVEKYYPVFLGDKVKKDVKGVVVEDKEFVKLFVEGPLNIPQFAALNSYCEMTNKKSSFIEKINGIFDKMKKDVVRTELMDLEKRIKRGPKVISGLFLSIGALLIAIAILYSSFTDDFGWNLKVTLCLWMVNWAVCFMLALTETEIKEKLKNLFFGLSGVLVILHIIWGIQCLGEDFGFHLWGSWIVLVGGLVVGINMGGKYSAKSFGPETKSLIDAIKKDIDKL